MRKKFEGDVGIPCCDEAPTIHFFPDQNWLLMLKQVVVDTLGGQTHRYLNGTFFDGLDGIGKRRSKMIDALTPEAFNIRSTTDETGIDNAT